MLRGPCGERTHVFHAFDVAHDVAKIASRRTQHAQAPTGFRHHIDDVGEREFGWSRQAIFDVFVTLAEDLQIERDLQCRAVGRFRTVNQALNEIPIPHHIDLKPKWMTVCRLGNVFDRANTHRGQSEGDAKSLRRQCTKNLTICMLHTRQACWGNGHRHTDGLANHGRARGAPFHVDGNTLTQFDFLKIFAVCAIRAFRPRAGIAVVVKHLRRALLVKYAQVFDAGDFGKIGHGLSLSEGLVVQQPW